MSVHPSDGYTRVPGVAVVTAHEQPDAEAYNRPEPVEVLFDFTPDDPAAPEVYRFPEIGDRGQRLTVGGGANPSRGFVAANGLHVGSRHRCERRELARGVGPPVLFTFPGLEGGDARRVHTPM